MLLKIIGAIARAVDLSPRRNIKNDQGYKVRHHSCSRIKLMWSDRGERERERERERGWKGGREVDRCSCKAKLCYC